MGQPKNLKISSHIADVNAVDKRDYAAVISHATEIARALPRCDISLIYGPDGDKFIYPKLTISRRLSPTEQDNSEELRTKLQEALFPGSKKYVVLYNDETRTLNFSIDCGEPVNLLLFTAKLEQIASNLDRGFLGLELFCTPILPINLTVLPEINGYSGSALFTAALIANQFHSVYGEFLNVELNPFSNSSYPYVVITAPAENASDERVDDYCKDLNKVFKEAGIKFYKHDGEIRSLVGCPQQDFDELLDNLLTTTRKESFSLLHAYSRFSAGNIVDKVVEDNKKIPPEATARMVASLLGDGPFKPGEREIQSDDLSPP